MTAHSRLGASSYERWGNCPGSVRECQGIPNVSNAYAEEGTRAHEVAAHFLREMSWPPCPEGMDLFDYEEMKDNLREYVDTILGEEEPGDRIFIEEKVKLTEIHPAMFGTLDCAQYKPKKKLLIVNDLKYGAGVAVSANTKQLPYYGLGGLLSLDIPPVEKVMVRIFQPRLAVDGETVRSRTFPAFELMEFAAQLQEDAERTEDPKAPLIAGEWCRWCPAAGKPCSALASKANSVAATVFEPSLPLDTKKLAETLNWLPVVESFAENVRKFAYQQAVSGVKIPGFKLVDKRATRHWMSPVAHDISKALGLEVKDVCEVSIKSPAQVEKLLDKAGKKKLEALVIKRSSGTTLVPESDSRPVSDATTAFPPLEESSDVIDIFT